MASLRSFACIVSIIKSNAGAVLKAPTTNCFQAPPLVHVTELALWSAIAAAIFVCATTTAKSNAVAARTVKMMTDTTTILTTTIIEHRRESWVEK